MIVIIMGVAGSGKTTIGRMLADALGWKFFDADDLHPQINIERMRQGIALTHKDREPWLERLHELLSELSGRQESAILAGSALRRAYRDRLAQGIEGLQFVYLKGDYALLKRRLKDREDHYFGAELLASQFETLEEPEGVPIVEVNQAPDAVVTEVRKALGI